MLGIKEFFYSLLRHWRMFIVVAVSLFVVGGVTYFAATGFYDSESSSELLDNWYGAKEYYIGVLKYTGVGNSNVESQVVRDAYISKFYGVDFKQYLKENYFSEEDSIEYINSLITVSTGGVNNCAVIEFIYYNEEEALELQNIIKRYVESLKPEMSSFLGEHKLFLSDSSVSVATGKGLSDKLQIVKDYLSSVNGFPQNSVSVFSVKKLVVYGVLAALIGEFLAAVFILISDSVYSRIYNLQIMSSRKNFSMIGDFSYLKLRGRIDKFLYRCLIVRKPLTEQGISRIVGYKLAKELPENTFVLTGADIGSLNRLKDVLKKENPDFNIVCRLLPDINADNIGEWESEVPVIYVAERFKDSQQEMKNNVEFYSNIGLKFIGAIFI